MRRSKRNRWLKRLMWAAVPLVLALGAGGWWYLHGGRWTSVAVARASAAVGTPQPEAARSDDQSPLIVELPDSTFTWPAELGGPTEVADKSGGGDDAEARGATSAPALSELPNPPPEPPREAAGGALKDDEHSGNPTIEAARKRQAEGHPIEARHELNALLQQRGLSRTDQVEVRKLLTVLADETVLSNRRLPDDPLTDVYVVQSGDVLLRIGRQFKVPAEILMQINGIKNAASLRAEQKIKVLKGPFHAKIYKSDFRLDVYLQDLYVRSFRVGLGADQGTPEGLWRVKERLQNPTYYPSPSAEIKRIIPADDPQNPLGERWIGLEGLEGDAKDRYGYGIHGTIEPDSIGRAVSLGCIRMHNEDVAVLYALLLPGESTVTILP